MHDKGRRFIYDQEIGVFENDIERNGLGCDGGGRNIRPMDFYQITGTGGLSWPRRAAIDPHASLRQQPLYFRARASLVATSKKSIEPFAWERMLDSKDIKFGHR
jgi:hypothetical protein